MDKMLDMRDIKRHFVARETVWLPGAGSRQHYQEARRDMADRLAALIVRDDGLFTFEHVGCAADVKVDCVVLTYEELSARVRGAFDKGVRHAFDSFPPQGFAG